MGDYKDLKIYSRRNLAEEPLIIDGISRSGKFMVSHVVSAFEGVEFIQYPMLLENLPYLVRFGKLDFETCRILLQTDLDYAAYNMMIGRTLNTRRADITGVHNSLDSAALLARAAREDEPAMVAEFLAAKRLPLFFCHEGMCNMGVILRSLPKAKVIHVMRDPAALALSWFKKGYGKRWGGDPKIVSIAFDTPHGTVPWFAVDAAKDYAEAGEMERAVLCLSEIMRMSREGLEALTAAEKGRILFLSFEGVTADPEPALAKIGAFTGKTRHPRLADVLARERLPRPAPDGDEAVRAVKERLSPRYRELLDRLRADYRAYWLPLAS